MPNPSEGAAAPERVWPRPSFWRRTPAPAAVASALSLALILVPNPSTSARAPEPIATLVPAAFAPVAGTRPEAGADLIGAAAAPGAASRLSAGASERPQAAPSEPVVDDQRPLSAPLGERLPDPSIGRENRPPAAGAVGDSLLVPTPTPTPRPVPQAVAVAPAPAVAPTRQQAAPTGGSWSVAQVSWYGPGFYGQRTACGTTLGTGTVGVAHRSLPCGTQVQFRNGGRIVTAPVIDRGPYSGGRAFDLSGALCSALAHCYTGAIEWRLP